MKTVITMTLTIISGIMFLGCNHCTEKYCADQNIVQQLEFKNFLKEDVDTFLVTRFVRNSNFSGVADSFFVYADDYNSNMTVEPKRITFPSIINAAESDFEVKLVSTQGKYQLSNFVISKKICNSCTFGKDEYYNHCDSYNINGSTITDWRVVISK